MVGYSNIINKKSSTTIPKDSFVAPSPSRNHSMLHQTFHPPLFRFPQPPNPFSATVSLLPPPPPPPPPSSLPEVERNPSFMDAGAAAAALQETLLPAAPPALEELEPEFVIPDDVNWAVEHATMLDDFLVDDLLLDFDEAEVEEIKQENTFEADAPTDAAPAAVSADDIFEPPPPLSPFSGLWSQNQDEFEWMSNIIDESMVEYPPSAAVPTFIPTTHQWLPAVKRARRTEGRRVPCSPWPCPFKSDSSGSSTTTVSTSSSSSSQYNTQNLLKYGSYHFDQQSKKPSRKPKNHQLPRAAAGGARGSSYGERSCTHCGSQKTPQWRLGPMGPKTLCNACGVRYKSGRLVPEYRPAASPTFIPQVHSSSHRKVMEMRRQKEMEAASAPPMTTC